MTGNAATDLVGNRTKRRFSDRVGRSVGAHTDPYRLQVYRRDTGQIMFDISVPIRVGGRLMKLADIATIRRGYEEPPSYLVRSRGQDAILLGLVMHKGENGLELGERLSDFVAAEQARLPLGIVATELGSGDPILPQSVGLSFAAQLDNCQLELLPEAGHMGMYECPEKMVEILREFLIFVNHKH